MQFYVHASSSLACMQFLLVPYCLSSSQELHSACYERLSLNKMLKEILKLPCYSGSLCSCLIAVHLLKMGHIRDLTFLNKMFLIYFTIESIIGWGESSFLFRLREERYRWKLCHLLTLNTEFLIENLFIDLQSSGLKIVPTS